MIHTLTLNPAIDEMLYLKQFQKNVTNRLTATRATIGGKGTHVSINLSLLGQPNCAHGVAHGATGQKIIDILSSYENIHVKFIHRTGNESRTNYLLIEDSGDCCILASHGVPLTDKDLRDAGGVLLQSLSPGDALVLSGDTGNCPDPYVYNRLLSTLSELDLRVYLDASGSTLKSCLSAPPFLIKPNQDELSQLCGKTVETEREILAAIESLESYGIRMIAVSLGGEGSIVKADDAVYRIRSPRVNVRNTIGCGDCYLSGLVYGLERGMPVEDTLRLAAAISSSAAESAESVGFDRERADFLLDKVTITKL